MKSIMYHYIREHNEAFPNFNYLNKLTFNKQIKKFSKQGLFSSFKDILNFNNVIIPTFDDSLKDHIWAAEQLKKNGAIGIFFIPTLPLISNKLLDVHKSHLILGKVNSNEALDQLNKVINKLKIKNFYNLNHKLKYKKAYNKQIDNNKKIEFKKIINYYGNNKIKTKILDKLLNIFEIKINAKNYYLSKKEIKYLTQMGMIIGSHGHSHLLMSKLSYNQQIKEISVNKKIIESITKKNCDFFCYPFGWKHSYNDNTLKILKKKKFKFAFSVDYRNITRKDLKENVYKLPRFDCNQFL